MNEKNKDIAARVKGLRLLSGLSIVEVAKAFDVSTTLYEQYENGEDDIPVSLLNEISNYFEVDMTEILTGISPKLHDVCMVKKGEGLRVERYDQYEFQSLAISMQKENERLLVTLKRAKPGTVP